METSHFCQLCHGKPAFESIAKPSLCYHNDNVTDVTLNDDRPFKHCENAQNCVQDNCIIENETFPDTNGDRSIFSELDFSKRVLLVGDIVVDKYIHGTCSRIASESPIPVFDEEKVEYRLGGTGNVLNNLIAMGLAVDIVSVLGNNDKETLSLLKQDNVDTSGLVILGDYRVKTITRYISNQHLCFRADSSKISALPGNAEEALLEKLEKLMTSRRYHATVLSDYGQGVLSTRIAQFIISNCRQKDIVTIVDPGKRGKYERFHGANYIKLNKAEIQSFSQEIHDLFLASKNICTKLHIKACIVTLADKGIAFYKQGSLPEFQIVPIEGKKNVIDVCGAGDTVLAAVSLGITHNWPLLATCKFSNVCAGFVIQQFGVITVSLIDVNPQNILNSRTELVNWRRLVPKGYQIVLTTGCFDLIHEGHISSLCQAKEQGDILVVALNSDKSVQKLKFAKRPVNDLEQRCNMLLATKYVDLVVTFDEEIPNWIVNTINPEVFVKGPDYSEDQIIKIWPNLRKIHITTRCSKISTTGVIANIKTM